MFEIWEIVNYGDGEIQPMFLYKSFENFADVYLEFQNLIKIKPCCIFYNKEKK
jgi:hypothetical protein